MKRIGAFLLSIAILLSGCGTEKLDVPYTEPSEASEPIVSDNSALLFSGNSVSDNTTEDEKDEPDKLWIMYVFEFDPVTLAPVNIYTRSSFNGIKLESGNLIKRDNHLTGRSSISSGMPFFEGEDIYHNIYPSEEHAKGIRKIFIDYYNDNLENKLEYFTDKYVYCAKVAAETDSYVEQESIIDDIPDKMVVRLNDSTIDADVAECTVSQGGSMLDSSLPKDIAVEYETRDDGYAYVTKINVTMTLNSEDFSPINDYIQNIYDEDAPLNIDNSDMDIEFDEVIKVDTDSAFVEDDESSGNNNSDDDLPEGKDFNQVTGYEGRWYYIPTGELLYELYSDGTGKEYTVAGVYSITWEIAGDHLMVQDYADYDGHTINGPNLLDDYIERR